LVEAVEAEDEEVFSYLLLYMALVGSVEEDLEALAEEAVEASEAEAVSEAADVLEAAELEEDFSISEQ
jgi:hypothetical protein